MSAIPPDAFDRIGDADVAELQALAAEAGALMAGRLIHAVSGVPASGDLHHVTRRQLATLRIALAVVSGP